MRPRLYLSGPITGIPHFEVVAWRRNVSHLLEPDIECVDPMRGMHEAFEGSEAIPSTFAPSAEITDQGILKRDHFDTCRADMVLCNVALAKKASQGTVMEIAWAYDRHIPVILVMEPEGNPHDHPMVRAAVTWRFEYLPPALELIAFSLLGRSLQKVLFPE